ncbi:hypothetical protein LPTSP4_33380 [Leptospira ryugenii]|uniref:4Fe-4S ferredoxin-type domain-containing protein n=1 Tax=Leptospira ryugenii TaxID=1917863 RepID=A0A2P2E4J1_9LEPT|nr:oxidoreductase [Leptospira ryugenii]GBF51800.1 hypothetical protein LPTSP4_33380 [Leptospira ryugenii]
MNFPKLPRTFTRKLHKTENRRERTIQGQFVIPVPTGVVIEGDFPRRVELGDTLVFTDQMRILAPVHGIVTKSEDGSFFYVQQDGAWKTNSPLQIPELNLESLLAECTKGALASLDFPDCPLDQYFRSFSPQTSFDIYLAPYSRYHFLPFSEMLWQEMPEACQDFPILLQKIFPKANILSFLRANTDDYAHPDGIPEYFLSKERKCNIIDAKKDISDRKILYLGPETIYHILRKLYYGEPFTKRHLYICLVDKSGRIDTVQRYYLLTNGQSLEFLSKDMENRYKVASFQSMFESVESIDIQSMGFFNIYRHSILLLYERKPVKRSAFACIDCFECNSYCPTKANPFALVKHRNDEFVKEDCVDCGICTLYCPAGIDLRTMIQLEKSA